MSEKILIPRKKRTRDSDDENCEMKKTDFLITPNVFCTNEELDSNDEISVHHNFSEKEIKKETDTLIIPDIYPVELHSSVEQTSNLDSDSLNNKTKKLRTFNSQTFSRWQQQFKWLREEDGNLICSICRLNEKAKQTSFVKGCRTFKSETVKKHETSEVHQKSCALYYADTLPSLPPAFTVKCEDTNYEEEKKMKGLVLGVYTERNSEDNNTHKKIAGVTCAFKDVDSKVNGKLSETLKATGPFYKSVKQRILWVPTFKSQSDNFDYDCISIIDLGTKDVKDDPLEGLDQKAENVRCAVASGVLALNDCALFDDIYLDSCGSPQSVSEAAVLSLYRYDELKQKSSRKPKSNLHLYEYPNIQPDTVQKYATGTILAESQNFARTLMQTPANWMTPSIFADKVLEAFKDTNVKVIVREQEWIESMKMGSFLSVTRGSSEKPKFIELHYNGLPNIEKNVAFVGKGITFDSGGISLKPSDDMDKMRADMGGAATVTGTILAASKLGLKINLKGFLPLCENLPSGTATKPGDVVKAMNGKTIQVDNTDAEGRLVLCDGICYAQKFKPDALIDIATLTGAIMIALGASATGAYSNDEELWNTLNKAGYTTGDRVWRMPLFKHYSDAMTTCDLADLNNIGTAKRLGGSCTAAAFLREFVEPDTKWMHLDIASVMECKKEVPYMISGMSGRPTRTLVQFLQVLSENFGGK